MYIYHALINAPSAHRLHINLKTIFLPGFSYLEPAPSFYPSIYLCQFSKIFLENLSLLKRLFFSPIALIYDFVCACVRAGGRACVLYTLNFANMCNQRMYKRFGPARVKHSKYTLLLLYIFFSSSRKNTEVSSLIRQLQDVVCPSRDDDDRLHGCLGYGPTSKHPSRKCTSTFTRWVPS